MNAALCRMICAALTAVALAACSRPAISRPDASPTPAGAFGYVRMTDLIKHHPLYSQLTGYDESIEALNLTPIVPDVAKPNADIVRQEKSLQNQLDAAAKRTQDALQAKSAQYQAREQQAIALALRSSGAGAPSAAAIARQIDTTARGQTAAVNAQAARDFDRYRGMIVAQDQRELAATQKALADRAQRQYRAKAEQLQAKESALSLSLADRDAAQRLSLRTRLTSLALDDTQRDAARSELAALDRNESDTLAQLKNRDAQTLAAYGAQLRTTIEAEMRANVQSLHTRSLAKLKSRESEIRGQFGAAPLPPTNIARGANGSNTLSPQLRSTLTRLHAEYQQRFSADAKATVADFQRTRDELRRRYAQLAQLDAAAQSGAQAQAEMLAKKRADLYGQMVAQIGREVRLIARERGIAVVVTDPVANAGGVDLTSDALKDIESLHE